MVQNMKGFKSLVVMTLTFFLVFSFMGNCNSAPQRLFERRNWTPQAMLYLKGAPGSRSKEDWGFPGTRPRLESGAPRPGRAALPVSPPRPGWEHPASPPRLARSRPGNSDRPGRAGAEPWSRLGRGAPLPFRPEPQEGPPRPAAARKTKPKFPTTNSSRGSSCTTGFFAETTRSWRRKLGSNQIPRI